MNPLDSQSKITKKASTIFREANKEVIAIGFEPMTVCLEGRCSIQLSYATILSNDRASQSFTINRNYN